MQGIDFLAVRIVFGLNLYIELATDYMLYKYEKLEYEKKSYKF